MSACTDNEGKVYFDEENKPGISNLLSIVAVIDNLTIEEVDKKYHDYNYKDFKTEVADKVASFINRHLSKTVQEQKFYEFRNDEDYLKNVLENGATKARKISQLKMIEVKEKVGLKL